MFHQIIIAVFKNLNNSFIDGILVLLQPSSDIVGHSTSIVDTGKVSILVGGGFGFLEAGDLSKRCLQFLLKGFVSSLGEKRFFFKNGPDTHGLLKHDDTGSQVHTEVNHGPVNAFLDILFLLNNEHVVVEELLQFFVDKVNGDLFKSIVFKNLETSNIKHSAEVGFFHGRINECVITHLNEPLEEAIEHSSGNTTSGNSCLLAGLTFSHPFSTNLDAGFAESLDHFYSINTPKGSNLPWNVSLLCILILSLIITSLGGVHNFSAGHHTGSNLKTVPGVIFTKSKDIEGIKSVFTLFIVINGGDGGLALGDEAVVVSIGGAETLGLHLGVEGLEELVEDMVGSLNFLLLSDTGLLQEIRHNVATSQFTGGAEMDTDELTETGGVVVPRGLGITIGLQNGVSSHNLVLKRNLLFGFLGAGGNNGQVGDDLLGVLGLSGTGLTGDQHGLILGVLHHATVGTLSDGPQMGWDFITPLAKVDLGAPEGVDRITLVGVDDNHEKTRVSMDQLALVASLQIPEDRSIVEEGQVDHVLALLELGRVDLANLSALQGELLVTNGDNAFASWILKIGLILEDTLAISMSLGVGDPDGLLGIVRLLLISPLDFQAGNQKLGRIWLLGSLLELDMARHG